MVSGAKRTHFATNLLLAPTMRDFASCFSEHAVKVSDSSCSGSGSGSRLGSSSAPSVQGNITCLYRSRLSTDRELLIKVTWSKDHAGPALSVAIDADPFARLCDPNGMNSQLLRKSKGSRSYVSGNSVIGLYWDISSAKYACGPEPVQDFYVVVIADAEFVLLLGDLSTEYINKFEDRIRMAKFYMISRREQVLGHSLYSTKARFHDNGRDHEIMIRCKGDIWDTKDSELWVCIDKKKVVHVRRLNWNFRGNQIIFIDGSPVDMMWDVHDWWFSGPSGHAVFLFRTRSALESRLWLEEETMNKEQGLPGFSLLIQAFKGS